MRIINKATKCCHCLYQAVSQMARAKVIAFPVPVFWIVCDYSDALLSSYNYKLVYSGMSR